MKLFSLLHVEINRLFHAKIPRALMLISIISPIFGLLFYKPLSVTGEEAVAASINSINLGNPTLAGGIISAIVFGLLTAFELNKIHRNKVEVLIDSMIPPFLANLSRILSIILVALVTQLITILIWIPFTTNVMGNVFNLKVYLLTYILVMFLPTIIGIFLTVSFYQICKRLDLTLVLFLCITILCFTIWEDNWLLRWINPPLTNLSDDFGNMRKLMVIGWNRLFWILLITGFWFLSCICLRCYNKGLFASIKINIKKFHILIFSICLILCSSLVYIKQPILDHSEHLDSEQDSRFSVSQVNYDANQNVYRKSMVMTANPNLLTGTFKGTVTYQLQNTSEKPETIIAGINAGYTIYSITSNGKEIPYRDLQDDNAKNKNIEIDLDGTKDIELIIEYGGFPQEWNIVPLNQGDLEISHEHINLGPSELYPMLFIDSDENSSPLIANIELPKDMVPVIPGIGEEELIEEKDNGNNVWQLRANTSIGIVAGDYISHNIEAAGNNIEFIYSKKHEDIMKDNNVDEVIKEVFDYCTEHYGPLNSYVDNKLRLIEYGSGGGFANPGVSVMSEDSFSEEGLNDPLKGASGGETLAHEIVHQWWGVQRIFHTDTKNPEWSAEGLTVYATYRMMKEKYGEEYAKKYYVDKWQERVDSYYKNFYVRNPEYLDALPEQYRSNIYNQLTSIKQYSEMPLKILKAEKLVGGEDAMDSILSQIFTEDLSFKNLFIQYKHFLEACNLTEEDLKLE
ncbi:MAG: hypothetical protein ACK5LC_13280 [Coprobacillaceae bacterium]